MYLCPDCGCAVPKSVLLDHFEKIPLEFDEYGFVDVKRVHECSCDSTLVLEIINSYALREMRFEEDPENLVRYKRGGETRLSHYRYDEYCPSCREAISPEVFAELFAKRKLRYKNFEKLACPEYLECPHCDASLVSELHSCLNVRRLGFTEELPE